MSSSTKIRDFAAGVYLFEARFHLMISYPSPLLHTVYVYTILYTDSYSDIFIHTVKGVRGGGEITQREG